MLMKKIYASSVATLDSDVYAGGGTDVTEKLQSTLDEALKCGGIHLIMDGAALVHGLKVHSNTTIECLSKTADFFSSAIKLPILENADRNFEVINNRNISLLGGTYNHNCKQQEQFVPVDDLKLRLGGKKSLIGATLK
jgi:hypothetical protein